MFDEGGVFFWTVFVAIVLAPDTAMIAFLGLWAVDRCIRSQGLFSVLAD
jgi:hypothetical protein